MMDDTVKRHFFELYCLALADGYLDFQELQTLYELGVEHGIEPEQINRIVLTADIPPTIPDTIDRKIEYLYDLTRLAWADGKIAAEERSVIEKCVIHYGFLNENAKGIVDFLIDAVKENRSKTDILNEING